MAALELFLGPKELVVTLSGRMIETTARAACTHEGDLRLEGCAILLSKISSLELWVVESGGELVELELVDASRENERKEGEEERFQHGGRQARGCVAKREDDDVTDYVHGKLEQIVSNSLRCD